MKPLLLNRLWRFITGLAGAVGLHAGAWGMFRRHACTPGFACHGCPWATFACPMGVMAQGAALRSGLAAQALGYLLLVGLLLGRLVCGFLCPFGWLQDLLHRIPTPKLKLPRWTRYGKYLALALLVFLLPFLLGMEQSGYLKIGKPEPNKDGDRIKLAVTATNLGPQPVRGVTLETYYVAHDTGAEEKVATQTFPEVEVAPGETVRLPEFEVENRLASADAEVRSPQSVPEQSPRYDLYYCKVCPVGTLTAHLPKYFGDTSAEGGIYGKAGHNAVRLGLLAFFLALAVFASRAFCRTFCPLGAVYALCSRFALTRIEVRKDACVNCGRCDQVCPVGLDVRQEAGGPECVACGACLAACPKQAIRRRVGF